MTTLECCINKKTFLYRFGNRQTTVLIKHSGTTHVAYVRMIIPMLCYRIYEVIFFNSSL